MSHSRELDQTQPPARACINEDECSGVWAAKTPAEKPRPDQVSGVITAQCHRQERRSEEQIGSTSGHAHRGNPQPDAGAAIVEEQVHNGAACHGYFVGARMERVPHCVQSVAVGGGSVGSFSSVGSRAAQGATDTMAGELEEIQMTLGEGPHLDATSSLSPVQGHNLVGPATAGAARWPVPGERAVRLDVSREDSALLRATAFAHGMSWTDHVRVVVERRLRPGPADSSD